MKIRSLLIRPHRIANLAFPGDGIIISRRANFGDSIISSDPDELGKLLASVPEDEEDPQLSQLGVTSSELLSYLIERSLAAQDYRSCFVALQQAVSKAKVVLQSRARKDDDPGIPLEDVLRAQIEALTSSSSNQRLRLIEVQQAYDAQQGLKGVQEPRSTSISYPSRTDHFSFPQKNNFSAQTTTIFDDDNDKQGKNVTDDFSTTSTSKVEHDRGSNPLPDPSVPNTRIPDPPAPSFWTGFTASHHNQISTVRSDGELRSPFRDSQIRSMDEIALNSQRLIEAFIKFPALRAAQFIERQDWTQAVLDVLSKQLDLCDCFILAPFSGKLNQVMKDAGEFARGGDILFRLEDDSAKLVVGRINSNSLLAPGAKLTATLQSEFEGRNSNLKLSLRILTVRGHDADNDEWEIVGAAVGDGWGGLPLNYTFDRESSTIALAE
jgi:hypothetical protein